MPGDSIGHYRIVRAVGEGGSGRVYEAIDTRLRRAVALKVLKESLAADRRWRERFAREARIAATLRHPNICSVLHVEEADGRPFMVMEYLEGSSVARWVQLGPMPTDEVVRVGIGVAEGLVAAHARGVIHGDIKPANVFLTRAGAAKILDFGVAVESPVEPRHNGNGPVDGAELWHWLRRQRAARATPLRLDGAAGTVGYMSPEQIRGEWLDARSDVFSTGVLLYEMATGRQPFDSVTAGSVCERVVRDEPLCPLRLNPALPLPLVRIIEKALQKRRAARYQSAEELSQELCRFRRQDVRAGRTLVAFRRRRAPAPRLRVTVRTLSPSGHSPSSYRAQRDASRS